MDKARERENTPLAAVAPNRYRSIEALNITVDATEELACPICRSSANTDYDYFSRAFGESRRFAATSEAVTDALGFCPQHGAALLSQTHLSRGIVRVFRDVIPRLIPLLVEKHIYEDQVQRIFFAADNACPACAHYNRTAARRIGHLARQYSNAPDNAEHGQLDTFCFSHFRILAGELNPGIRMAALTRYADTLDHTAGSMEDLLQSGQATDAWPVEYGTSASHRAVELIAGRAISAPDHDEGVLGDVLQCCPTLSESIAYAKACPLCLEVERARLRWISNISLAAKLNLGAWLFFPTCPEHIWTVVRIGDPRLIAAVATQAVCTAAEYLRRHILALLREAELKEALATAPIVRWGRRRRRKRTEGPVPVAPRAPKCPTCERLGVAEEFATGHLLELLQKRQYRNAFNRGYGLCMKHFAQIYPISPKGIVRSTLAVDQQNRLAEFALMLDTMIKAIPEKESIAKRDISWRLASHRFCGFM
jgi:hypothetical protein